MSFFYVGLACKIAAMWWEQLYKQKVLLYIRNGSVCGGYRKIEKAIFLYTFEY